MEANIHKISIELQTAKRQLISNEKKHEKLKCQKVGFYTSEMS